RRPCDEGRDRECEDGTQSHRGVQGSPAQHPVRRLVRESFLGMEGAQKPLELILARNLITTISTPAFLLDDHARLVYYNEAAGALLGRSFEETGRMTPAAWLATFGPFDDDG